MLRLVLEGREKVKQGESEGTRGKGRKRDRGRGKEERERGRMERHRKGMKRKEKELRLSGVDENSWKNFKQRHDMIDQCMGGRGLASKIKTSSKRWREKVAISPSHTVGLNPSAISTVHQI